jgi:hypothetical protein
VDLPSLTLRPQQIIDVDLSALRQAAASRTDLDSVSAQIAGSGAPGSLIGATYSTDAATGLTYDVPLRDSGKVRNATGSYPWRVDNDYSTIVVVTNVGNEPARFQVEIRYPDGPYSIKQRELAVGETATFDLRKLRDEQQPDRTGKTLPLTLDRGQFHWTIVATHGDPHIIGRAEVVSRSGRVASSYSCPVCCPDSGPNGGFDPNAYGLSVDGFVYTNAHGDYYDCYFNHYQGSLYFASMLTYDTNIATVDAAGQLGGVAVGNTEVEGDYDYVEWSNDGMDCYRYYGSGSDTAPVNVDKITLNNITVYERGAQFGAFNIANLGLNGSTHEADTCGSGPSSPFEIRVHFTLPAGASLEHDRCTAQGYDDFPEWIVVGSTTCTIESGQTGRLVFTAYRAISSDDNPKINVVVGGTSQAGGNIDVRGSINLTCTQ